MTSQQTENNWRWRVFDSLSYPTRVLLTDGTIIAANKRYLEQWGDDTSFIGQTCKVVNHKHSPKQTFPCNDPDKCPLKKTLQTKKGQSVVFSSEGEDGQTKWEDRVFSPIFGQDGEISYIIESIRDITEVKVLEKMYSGVRELIDNVVQSSVAAIVSADHKGQIILVNKAAEKLFGYTTEESHSINIEHFYPKGVARAIMAKLRDPELGGKGKLSSTRLNILTKDGEQIPVDMTAAIIYEDGQESATAAIFNDVREKLSVQKKLEEAQGQVMQTEKMASLGRLAAGVAHEINNPLTSILLYGNVMHEKLEDENPLKENLNYILEDAERCKDIVKNLLAYSRQTNPTKDVIHINSLVDEGLRLIRDQKLFMHITVIKDLATYPIFIDADKAQLCQVMINLIINAIDAMKQDGKLTLKTYSNPNSRQAYLEVTDTGSGIPEEHRSKIFDPFFTTKALGEGTGLGLSMAYGILKDNNGKISIKQTGPMGTTIILQLPAIEKPETLTFDTIG